MRGRLAACAAIVATAVGGAWSSVAWPVAGARGTAPSASGGTGEVTRVSLPAVGPATVPVCPGPQTLVVSEGATSAAPSGPVAVGAVLESDPRRRPATLSGRVMRDGDGGLALAELRRTSAGLVTMEVPATSTAPAMSAVQVALNRSGGLRGLAALACPGTATQSWLVGGGTRVGRRGRLILANPSAAPAEASVTVHGPRGPAGGPAALAVPARGLRSVRIDALAPGLGTVAVHVRARSGRISATLQDSFVQGLTPSGVDDVGPAAPAARRQVIPGILVVASGAGTPAARGAATVRVANPGAKEAVARVTLLGEGGPVTLPGGVLTLGPGAVRDVPARVPEGMYTAVVEADSDIVAGAVVGDPDTASGGRPLDFGWASSVEAFAGPALLALPRLGERGRRPAVTATLVLTAPDGQVSLEISQVDVTGRRRGTATVTVPAGSSVRHALLPEAAAVALRPAGRSAPVMAAAVLVAADPAGPMVSVVPVRPSPERTAGRPAVVSDIRLGL
jgi:hypothetical protein